MPLVALYESWLFPLVRTLTVPLRSSGLIMGECLVARSGILLVDYTNTLRERRNACTTMGVGFWLIQALFVVAAEASLELA